jgi:hypothetical protein
MLDQQDRKFFLRLCALAVLAAGLWYFSGKSSGRNFAQDHTQAATTLPITTRQLPPTNGTVSVELKCGHAELSAPNAVEKFPCTIINNTNKRISAVAVTYSISLEKDGKVSSHDEVLTLETFVHSDIREERKDNLIPPGGERPVRPLPVSFDDALIKAVSMQVDYVEFEDASSTGPDKAGSRIIAGIREGAAKYRKWLLGRYGRSGKSIDAMTALIQDDAIPEGELGIENENQRQGAFMYRNYLLRTSETKGVESLARFLERKSRPK